MKTALKLILVFICFVFTASSFAGEISPEIKKELRAFQAQYRKAFDSKNIDGVMAMYAPDAVLMGTGEGELYRGKDAIRMAHIAFFRTFEKEDYSTTWMKAGAKGDIAWISACVR